MLSQRHEQILLFLKEIDKCKSIERKILTSSGRPENDAEHAWHMAMMILLFDKDLAPEVDRLKLIKLALMHDLVEIYAGDTFAYDKEGKATQKQREDDAAKKLFSILPDDMKEELESLRNEFENRDTSESKHAVSFDKLHPMLMNLFTEGSSWSKFKIDYKTVDDYKRPMMEHDPFVLALYEHALKEAKDKGYIQ